MIYKETILKNADNLGIIWSKCIKIEGKSNVQIARLGYRILITLFRVSRKKKIKKKIYVGLVITTKMYTKRKDGTFLKFFQNRVLTLSEQLKFLGTRIYGPITREIKKDEKGTLYKKIISYTSTI